MLPKLGLSNIYRLSFKNDILRKLYFVENSDEIHDHNIAIHIRRGDLSKKLIKAGFDCKYYTELIKSMKKIYPSKQIEIFTEQKNSDDLKILAHRFGINIYYGNDSNIREHFHKLVCASVLIPSASTFSVLASEISRNIIYFDLHLKSRARLTEYKKGTFPENFVIFNKVIK